MTPTIREVGTEIRWIADAEPGVPEQKEKVVPMYIYPFAIPASTRYY